MRSIATWGSLVDTLLSIRVDTRLLFTPSIFTLKLMWCRVNAAEKLVVFAMFKMGHIVFWPLNDWLSMPQLTMQVYLCPRTTFIGAANHPLGFPLSGKDRFDPHRSAPPFISKQMELEKSWWRGRSRWLATTIYALHWSWMTQDQLHTCNKMGYKYKDPGGDLKNSDIPSQFSLELSIQDVSVSEDLVDWSSAWDHILMRV